MVPMEVRVHQISHRLGGDLFLDLGDQPGRGRRFGVRVHDEDIGRVHKDCGIAISHRLRAGKGEVDPVGDILDLKQVSRGAGSRGLRPSGAACGQAEHRRSRQPRHHIPEEVAARNSVAAHNSYSLPICRDSGHPSFRQSTPATHPEFPADGPDPALLQF